MRGNKKKNSRPLSCRNVVPVRPGNHFLQSDLHCPPETSSQEERHCLHDLTSTLKNRRHIDLILVTECCCDLGLPQHEIEWSLNEDFQQVLIQPNSLCLTHHCRKFRKNLRGSNVGTPIHGSQVCVDFEQNLHPSQAQYCGHRSSC